MKKLFTLALLLICVGAFAQKVKIQLNLKKDSAYRLVTHGKLTVVQDIPDHNQTVDIAIDAEVKHKVIAIRDTVYDLEVTYASMGMHMSVGGTNIDISTNDQTNPLSKVLSSFLNTPFNMSISRSCRVISVSGMEKIYDNMMAGMKDMPDAQKAQMKAQMEKSFGERSIKNNFQEAFAVFPKNTVGINDTWTAVNEMESSGINASFKTTYTLKQIGGDAYAIHADAVVTPQPVPDYRSVSGMELRYTDVKGTETNDIKLDKNTCWILESKATKNLSGTLDIKDSPKVPGGMTFPMSISGDITTTGK